MIENANSVLGYYCGTTQICIHINEPTYICPIIDYARDFEAGKFKKIVIPKQPLMTE